MTHRTPRLADIVPSTPREPEDTGTWTQTDSGMVTRFLPSTWHHHINQHLDGLCMEEVTADFSGRTHACHQPAKSLAYDVFTNIAREAPGFIRGVVCETQRGPSD